MVLSGLVDELDDVVERLCAEASEGTWSGLRGPALVDTVGRLLRSLDRAGSVGAHGVHEVHASGELLSAGFVSTARWLQAACGLAEAEARGLLARSRAFSSTLATTWQAWSLGEISGAAAREISLAVSRSARHVPVADRAEHERLAEQVLLGIARTRTVGDVRRAADTLQAVLDPDGASAAAMAAYDSQQLSCSRVGSMEVVSGYLSHESWAVVSAALEQIIDRWYREGSLSAEDLPTGDERQDARRSRMRRPHLLALALVELARRPLESGELGSRHQVKPHITLTVDAADLAARSGGDLELADRSEPIRLPDTTIRRILCDAAVDTVVTATAPSASGPSDAAHSIGSAGNVVDDGRDNAGLAIGGVETADLVRASLDGVDVAGLLELAGRRVLYVGRTHRTVPTRLRRALERRDRHCAFPDCRVQPPRCHAHHVLEWENGGPTELANCVLLCTAHHHRVHEGGWTVSARPDRDPGQHGYWAFDPPRPRP